MRAYLVVVVLPLRPTTYFGCLSQTIEISKTCTEMRTAVMKLIDEQDFIHGFKTGLHVILGT